MQDCPTFEKLAPEINDWIKDADLAGYNSHRFDIPLLAEEFLRVGIDFDMSTRKAIDVQMVFYRTVVSMHKFSLHFVAPPEGRVGTRWVNHLVPAKMRHV